MLTKEQKTEFSEILEELGNTLDISETQFNAAVESYNAVGNWLCADDSLLKPFSPTIKPQGSFLIGTTIQPYDENQDLDIDLVCELSGKNERWTQKDLKVIVGGQLEKHKTYRSLLDEEGRRCWTLKYRENSKRNDQYHMDILPAVIAFGYTVLLEKAFSNVTTNHVDHLAISITDREEGNYNTEKRPEYWLKSNPFGYAKWFIDQATVPGSSIRMFSLNEAVKPTPKYQRERMPLQRVVQILKRHRDMMFKDDKEKPISIIITTLAAYAYEKQTNVLEALVDVIDRMHLFIKTKYDPITGEFYRCVENPVNDKENFADKWRETPAKETKFMRWLEKVKEDISNATAQRGNHNIMESLSKAFGKNEITRTFTNIGERKRLLTEQGKNRFDTKLGITAGAANVIKPHNFYGSED
ncbi:nucleotidyltransferase [Pontibacter chitinilyticus]|uniref:nucleotidyltransferase n=1 Tax=Pontibacter chitinilyticus TaxID=2674989 RepID=UPI003219C819